MKRPRNPQRSRVANKGYGFTFSLRIGEAEQTAAIVMNVVDIMFLSQYWNVPLVEVEKAAKRVFHVDIQKNDAGEDVLTAVLTMMKRNGKDATYYPASKILPPTVHRLLFNEETLTSA